MPVDYLIEDLVRSLSAGLEVLPPPEHDPVSCEWAVTSSGR
jgi:hypothetical protein